MVDHALVTLVTDCITFSLRRVLFRALLREASEETSVDRTAIAVWASARYSTTWINYRARERADATCTTRVVARRVAIQVTICRRATGDVRGSRASLKVVDVGGVLEEQESAIDCVALRPVVDAPDEYTFTIRVRSANVVL